MEIVLAIISVLFIFSVILSFIKNDYWVFKILEYPRLQKLVLILVVGAGWALVWPVESTIYKIIIGGLFLSIIYLVHKIWPYTRFAKTEMMRVDDADPENQVRIFSANVLQDNKKYDAMLQQIRSCDPDIVFLLETNSEWAMAMNQLTKDRPYTLLAPLENTYGLLLYSRLKLENPKINFLVKEDIPSVEAVVVLPSGRKFKIWGLHPEPPVPHESLYATAKDKELMKVALMAKESMLPCIVFGDLNDVAWSHTTELFRKTSELLDPRRGRGFYSTFSAHSSFIRYPLDYIFCSPEFGLVAMKRMPKNGSDHFATYTHLVCNARLKNQQEAPKADKGEIKEAKEKATQKVKE